MNFLPSLMARERLAMTTRDTFELNRIGFILCATNEKRLYVH